MIDRRTILKCLAPLPVIPWIAAKAQASILTEEGLVTVDSRYPVGESLDRLEGELKARGIAIFARIDHAAGAASVSLPLRPTQLLIFGSPRTGTPLMQSNQAIGIDLPLKVLAWQDAGGKVWLTYNDPRWLARRYRLGADSRASVDALVAVLADLVEGARG
jgi:uncharacterized protein (DUF302 family)